MAVKSIIRAKSGAARREVSTADIVIHDVRACPLFLPDERWIGAVSHYYDDLVALLAAVRADGKLPQEFLVPDLWHTSILLPMQEREMMLDMWHLGHDLAEGIGYESCYPADGIRNKVGGTVFRKSSPVVRKRASADDADTCLRCEHANRNRPQTRGWCLKVWSDNEAGHRLFGAFSTSRQRLLLSLGTRTFFRRR